MQETITLLRAAATVVVPVATVQGIAADAEDDLVLATAVAGDARFLVTADKHLQGLSTYQGIEILSPRQFLDLLGPEGALSTE